MSDFQSFRDAVLEDDALQEQVISIVNTATANDSGLGDGIATLAKTHGYTITSEEVYEHADFLGEDGDLTDFELEMISGAHQPLTTRYIEHLFTQQRIPTLNPLFTPPM